MGGPGELIVAEEIVCSQRAPARAREILRTALGGRLPEIVVDALLLAASELVSNCVRHAGLHDEEKIDVIVRQLGDDVRLEVCDGGPGFDAPASSDAADAAGQPQTSGRGLRIIKDLAADWGVGRQNDKNMVWVRLDSSGKGLSEPDPD